ncbi:MAG: class I poly(R)-hydroxyalkanoic acid synthase [Gammaproteobacteria bacterium]|jgi:polyhydroxyalkanoate synthase|nr:class I poly(R)-hydroxyalkanoic acid synthase [Gammaproteobacteria bacterium]
MSDPSSKPLHQEITEAGAEVARIVQLSANMMIRLARSLELPDLDPLNLKRPLLAATLNTARHPQRILAAQWDLTRRYLGLVRYFGFRVAGVSTEPAISPARADRRFRSEHWNERLIFDLMRQAYLLTADWMLENVARMQEVSRDDRLRIRFYTRQFADALSPSNFILTNPEVLAATREEKGLNLLRGFRALLEDLSEGNGQLLISMTDKEAFEVGRNIATTEGAVVFENEMMQLIQYAPRTKTAYARPLVIIPPWINKFYILDLQPNNSFIRWAVDRGYTVFVVSWVNPDEKLRYKHFEDYMHQGILAALDAVERATGQREVNTIGYCIGGTLLAATLAWMKARDDDRIQSATFFAAQVDFSEAGDLRVFIDDKQLKGLEKRMKAQGYLDGEAMALTFNMLRANDLIWTFVVNNYLLGRKPADFDLLFWNSDFTRLPETMHTFYLREMYLENRLVEPGGIEMGGVPIDLTTIDLPVYIQSSREDHIAPYPSVYKATQIYSGDTTFMLAGSGHIAGVINPPAAEKYGYWTNDDLPADPEDWIAGAEQHRGSWWPHWDRWLKQRSGRRVSARQPGDGDLDVIEAAPGRYVKG